MYAPIFARDVLPIRDSLIATAELALADMLDRARLFEEATLVAEVRDLDDRRRDGFERVAKHRACQLGEAVTDLDRACRSLEDAGEFDASSDVLRRMSVGLRAMEPGQGT